MSNESKRAKVARILNIVIQKNGMFWDGGVGTCIYCGVNNTSGFKHYKGCVIDEIKELVKGTAT